MKYRTVAVDGGEIFYREAGAEDAPTVLLLHDFPSSSHEFRHLIPALAASGFSEFPKRMRFRYGFESFADVIDGFREAICLERHALYLHDYGAHVGFRVVMRAPERVTVSRSRTRRPTTRASITSPKAYWRDPSAENLARLREILTEEGTRAEFVGGLPDSQVELCSPEMWKFHWPLLERPGNIEMQLDSTPTRRNAIAAESPPTTMALTNVSFLDQGLALDELPGQGDQLLGKERLAQDTHGAVRPLTEHAGGRVFFGDGEDHGYLLGLGYRLQAVTGFQAIDLGHAGVHDDQIHLPAQGLLQRLLAIHGLHHLEAGDA